MSVRILGKWIGRCVIAAALVWVATFLAISAYVFIPRTLPSSTEPADAIVCLGAGMSRTEGWLIADNASHRRAVTCADLYRSGVAPVIVFTGYGHDVSSAAAAMARVAQEHGVPDDAIILEEQAQSTIQNAAFSIPLLPENATRLVVVSDQFHLPRSAMIFRAFSGLEIETFPTDPQTVGPDTSGRLPLQWTIREATAIWVNVARASAYWLGGVVGISAETRISWFN